MNVFEEKDAHEYGSIDPRFHQEIIRALPNDLT
jgi:hypothetical protein